MAGTGGRRPGAGRPRGSRNKATAAKAAAIAKSGITPLDYMLRVMRQSDNEAVRLDAAKAAAPYVHPRLQAIEHSGKDGGPIETKDVTGLELSRRIAYLLTSGLKG